MPEAGCQPDIQDRTSLELRVDAEDFDISTGFSATNLRAVSVTECAGALGPV